MWDFLLKIESILEKACGLVEKLAPVAQMVAPLTGPAAPAVAAAAAAANIIATATDKALAAHEANGQSAASAVAGFATIAQAVAASGVVSSDISAKIQTMTGGLSPEVLAMIDAP